MYNLFSSVLHIRYYSPELNSEFTITGVSGNQAQALFSLNEMNIPVTVYRQSDSPNAPAATNIWFAGADINPDDFVGGTGRYTARIAGTKIPDALEIGGAYPSANSIVTFSGLYLRQD